MGTTLKTCLWWQNVCVCVCTTGKIHKGAHDIISAGKHIAYAAVDDRLQPCNPLAVLVRLAVGALSNLAYLENWHMLAEQ
jgi:hypothetical protein